MTASDGGSAVALVTGGSSGLGAAIAADLAARGHRVVIADLQEPPEALLEVASHEPTDVTDAASVRGTVEAAVSRHGRLDVLVNCAGIWFRKPFLEIDPSEWDRVCAVNLRGPFLCCQAVTPVMRDAGGGSIVNIGSQAGVSFTRGQGAHYHASKAGLTQLTRVLAFELGPLGVRVNCVAPGAVTKPGRGGAPASAEQRALMDRFRQQTALERFVTQDEVVAAVSFFCSSESEGVTGQTLLVNGGALGYA